MSETRILRFEQKGPSVYKIYDVNVYFGAISRSGTKFIFLPEPFVAFDATQLEQIMLRIKELEYDANNS